MMVNLSNPAKLNEYDISAPIAKTPFALDVLGFMLLYCNSNMSLKYYFFKEIIKVSIQSQKSVKQLVK